MSKNSGFVFRRPDLASSIADGLVGAGIQDFTSGLFLAAPRRTGKSTFLREDLVPECQARGWLAVYVDLWADKEKDPADLISSAIAGALVPFEKGIRKLAKNIGIEKLSFLRTLSWDFTKPQLPAGATLTQALELLHSAAEKTVVLVIDEAQHALTTEAGVNAMFALKAARDQLNQGREGEGSGLRLVFTGSNRDKLAHLVLGKSQPFFGSSITPFPLLGKAFTQAYTVYLNGLLAKTNQFNAADIDEAFELVGRRPEMLRTIIGEVALELGGGEQSRPTAAQSRRTAARRSLDRIRKCLERPHHSPACGAGSDGGALPEQRTVRAVYRQHHHGRQQGVGRHGQRRSAGHPDHPGLYRCPA